MSLVRSCCAFQWPPFGPTDDAFHRLLRRLESERLDFPLGTCKRQVSREKTVGSVRRFECISGESISEFNEFNSQMNRLR